MSLKRYVEGKGWVSIAGPSSSSNSKAVNVSITDSENLFDSINVEGALSELAYDMKIANSKLNRVADELSEHKENHPSGGGGGGGGGTGAILPTITSDFEIKNSDGKTPIEIPIFFTSPSLGDGTVYILVKNIEVATQQIQQGNNTVIVPPTGAGKNINISIYVKDRAGLISNQLTWVITAGGIEIFMITDTKADYDINDRIALAYTVTCISTDDIFAHFVIDGEERQVKSINGYNSYDLTGLSIGIHKIEYWATSGDFITNKYKFNLIVVDADTIIVSTEFDSDLEYESGIPISIPYRVSITRNEDFTVNMYINGQLDKTIVTRPTALYWSITSLDPGDYTLKIEAFNESLGLRGEVEFGCKVIEGEYSRIQPVIDASLLCWFDATDKTNNDANREIWTDKIRGNKAYLHNFNYGSNGWMTDEEKHTSELKMDGTCYVEMDITPFKNNFKNGGTIEIVFKARDVGNDAARILDITDVIAPYKGVYLDTREAYLLTEGQTTYASVGENEYIHVMYQIDRTNKYAHVIINGVITRSCKLGDYGTGTSAILESIAHEQKVYLNSRKGQDLFGSCEVKHFRVYERALTFDEILQNYLSTIEDIKLQKSKSDFNDPLKNIMPIMNITCDPAELEKMTDTNQVEVSMTYTSPNTELYGQTLTTATKCLMYWQGTSSVAYNIKNYNIILRDDNGQEILYSPYPNCIPQSLFCLKANLMESTNAHNVGLADYVRKYLYTKPNPAQQQDSRASRTIQGFPFILYINGEMRGVYDFNLDRYSATAFGYDLPAHKNKCKVYEISANTNFTAGAFIPWTVETGIDEWSWYKNDFSGLYPPTIQNSINDDFAEIKNLIKFVHDSNDEVFMTTFETYFDKESVLRYYIMVMVLGLVDSLGKNAKLVTYDGIKWYFEFYDMDTAMGLDNTGAFKYDVDIEVDPNEFNTADSTLWTRVRTLFFNDLVNEYNLMRNQNLTLDKIYECLFTNQIEKIPESQYNFSTQKKYLDSGEYIMMSNGNRYYNLKRWIKERLIYCDTLFNYTPTTSKFVTVRSGVEGEAYLDIETYYPMYVTIEWRNQADGSGRQTIKVERNKRVRFNGIVQAKDQEVLVYGADHLKTISGLEGIMPRHLLLNNASKITSIECPNNTELLNIQMNNCTYLQRLDLRGCSKLGTLDSAQVLDVSGCNNLRYLNAYGTVVTSINTNQSGGNLVELYVPKTLQTLSLQNQYSLEIVGIPGSSTLESSRMYDLRTNAANISSFTLINCPKVRRLNYANDFTASTVFFDNYSNERRGSELREMDYRNGEWKRLMSWGNGLSNCNSIYIENSCYDVEGMSFRGITKLTSLTLRAMPGLKCLMLGANCCGYRFNNNPSFDSDKYDIISEFDWDSMTIKDCPNIEEFRIHEMYPNGYNEGSGGNLTYFTFKPGTETIRLSDKFPNLKIFECNLATQNIHQWILPQSLESVITTAWNKRHDEGYPNEVKLSKFNIDSVYFEGEHDMGFIGVDLGNHPLKDSMVIAPYADKLLGVNITNEYVNPIFNDLKEENSEERPFITPTGRIDLSNFKWRTVSDWFAYTDFTNTTCEILTPSDWDAFLRNVTTANRMFYYCKNPDFTWEFAMKFFSKIENYSGLNTMYKYAILAEQQDYNTDGVVMQNPNNIGQYNYNGAPFRGSNLKYIKSFTLTACNGAYGTFYNSNIVRIGNCSFTGTKNSNWGIDYLFYGCRDLEEVGSITSSATAANKTTITMNNTFDGCIKLKRVGSINLATSTINSAYFDCFLLEDGGLALPDLRECTDIRGALRGCRSLTNIEFGSSLDKVVYADNACRGCTSVETIHMTGLKETSAMQQCSYIFADNPSLRRITLDGATLPAEIRDMSYAYSNCTSLETLPAIPSFTYDTTMQGCCIACDSLTDATIYTNIPIRVINVNNMYQKCAGIIYPVVNVNSDHVLAKQMFKECPNVVTLTANFNGRLLRDSSFFADSCNKVQTINFKFPSSLVMHEYYQTGVTYYNMFQKNPNLKVVNLDMSKLADTNTKADFGAMFYEDKYIEQINGLDFSCLKKPARALTSSGQNPYDYHDDSITYGANYENLYTLGIVGVLSTSYNFRNITTLKHTKEILKHLDTVTSETIGLTYNVIDAIDDEKTENVDEELRTLALAAINKGWSFTIV